MESPASPRRHAGKTRPEPVKRANSFGSRIKLLSLSSTEPSKKRVVLKGSSEAATSPNTPEKPSRKDSSLQKSTPSAEPARASLPAKIPKPPENTVRKPTELTFEALPEKIKLKCMESDVPLQQYKDDIELLYDCAKFIYGAEFGISKLECRTTGKITTYASEELVEFGKTQIIPAPKPIKKLFSNCVEIGAGGYGKVFNCVDKQMKTEVAIKKLRHDCDKRRTNNYTEIAFLASANHPNIVKFHKAYYSAAGKKNIEECWVVMEFMHGGTVREAVKFHKFTEKHIAFISREILQAISYMHGRGWAHRDLKSSNVMLGITSEIKLIDFGLCCEVTCSKALSKQVGSPYWMAPEILRDRKHSNKCDIWSAGVICLEMLLGRTPYYPRALQTAFLATTVGLHHLIPKDAPKDCADFLLATLQLDPNKRPTADTLLDMNWFKLKNIDKGIKDIFRDILLANRLNVMAASAFG